MDYVEELIGETVEDNEERYRLTWPGKREAILKAGTPTDKVLRPMIEDSLYWETTQNLFIEGDNLDALKLLLESHRETIKFIYIDPPYNTGKDLIYNDYFPRERECRTQSSRKSPDRCHSGWLSMMYPRLKLAREFLSQDGVILISIDDNEVHNLRLICDEIFGEKNFVTDLIWRKSKGSGNDSRHLMVETEHILLYAKDIGDLEFAHRIADIDSGKYRLKDAHFDVRGGYNLEKLDRGSKGYLECMDFGIMAPDGSWVFPNHRDSPCDDGWRWVWSKKKVKWGIENDYIVVKRGRKNLWSAYYKNYAKVDNRGKPILRTQLHKNHIGFEENILNIQAHYEMKDLFGHAYFSYPKPTALLQHLLKMFPLDDATIMDFFAGSATTAHAVMALNAEDGGQRKYIMVQLAEPCDEDSRAYRAGFGDIAKLALERIRRAGRFIERSTGADIDYGFRVYRVDTVSL